MQCAAIGTIALGIVLVLLLGEIDLSVGSVSGLAAAVLAVGLRASCSGTSCSRSLAAIAVGCLVGHAVRLPVHAIRRAELRHHARGSARLPRAAALGARRHRIDQPARRLVDRAVRPADVPAAVGVVRGRRPRRRRLRVDAHATGAAAAPPRISSARATARSRCAAARSSPSCSSPSGTSTSGAASA